MPFLFQVKSKSGQSFLHIKFVNMRFQCSVLNAKGRRENVNTIVQIF